MSDLQNLLSASAARHSHLCPRQVLGVRIGLAGTAALGLDLPRHDKRLLVIVETDGCFADGIEVATGAAVGHRTLRVEDYGKVAAAFVDTATGRAVRLAPRLDVRQRAALYAPHDPAELNNAGYLAQLHGYQIMPENELLFLQEIRLAIPVEALISRPDARARCAQCGEEIINAREVFRSGEILCRACAGNAYYRWPDDR